MEKIKKRNGTFWRHWKKISENKSFTKPKNGDKSHVAEKLKDTTLLLWKGFVFHVRGSGCVQNQVLRAYGKSAQCHNASAQKWTIQSETNKKTSHRNSLFFSLMENHRLKTLKNMTLNIYPIVNIPKATRPPRHHCSKKWQWQCFNPLHPSSIAMVASDYPQKLCWDLSLECVRSRKAKAIAIIPWYVIITKHILVTGYCAIGLPLRYMFVQLIDFTCIPFSVTLLLVIIT